MYSPVSASTEQCAMLYAKHLKPTKVLGVEIGKIISRHFEHESEDDIGFVTLHTRTGKKIEYQMRGDEPCFIEFMGFGHTRYDIPYPTANSEMYLLLKKHGIEAKKDFWKGSQI